VLPIISLVFTVIWIGENGGEVESFIVLFFIAVVGVVCRVMRQFVRTAEIPPYVVDWQRSDDGSN
jgi:hypothetical protein